MFCPSLHLSTHSRRCLIFGNTRGALQASNSCDDKFCLGLITKEADLCRGCFAFNEIHVKKKPQMEMGRQFHCLLPTAGAELPAAELTVI
jgi:hypothetical protein